MRGKNVAWGAQKGTRVRWAKDRRSGEGTIVKVYGVAYEEILAGKETEWDVKDDATGDTIRCTIAHIRHLNTPNRVKKRLYAEKRGL